MKTVKSILLTFLALAFTATVSRSQDIITTKKGEDILAKIFENTKTDIKYRLYDDPEGPVYTLLKSDILMIRYDNGSKEIFTEESKSNSVPSPTPYQPGRPEQVQPDQKLLYAKAEKYRRMKGKGASLTILGGVLFIVGAATLSNASYYYNANGTTTSSGSANTGAAALLIGMGALGAGIPLWIVGAHNERKYEKKLQGLSFRFNANPQGKGLLLTYRF